MAEPHHLDLETHPFLGDHRLSGRPVLPLASALEMMAEFGDATPPFALHDVRVERGLILFSEEADVDLEIEDGRIILREVRSKGRVIPAFSARLGTPTEGLAQTDPPVDAGRGSEPLDSFYRDHAFHGPRMRAVEQVLARNDQRIVGRVRTSRPTDWQPRDRRPRWRLDPLVIDGAFQLALYQSLVLAGRRMVPMGVRQVAWLRDPLDATVIVTLSTRGEDLTCDALIVDSAGCVGYLCHAWGRFI